MSVQLIGVHLVKERMAGQTDKEWGRRQMKGRREGREGGDNKNIRN